MDGIALIRQARKELRFTALPLLTAVGLQANRCEAKRPGVTAWWSRRCAAPGARIELF
jgi:hypothetical protein